MNGISHEVFHELKRLFGDDREGLAKTLKIFLLTAEQLLAQLQDAHENGNLPEMVRIAHGLGSSCGNVGANGMHTICREIEKNCRANTNTDGDAKLKALSIEFELVKDNLSTQLEILSAN